MSAREYFVTVRCGCGSVHKIGPGRGFYQAPWASAPGDTTLAKRAKAHRTAVAIYVDEHAPRLAARLSKIFARMRRAVAMEVEKQLERRGLLAQAKQKAVTSVTLTKDDLVDAVVRELELEDYDDDIIRAVRPLIEEAFRDAGLYGLEQVGVEVNAETKQNLFDEAKKFAEARAAELVGKRVVGGHLVDNPDPRWAITDTTREGLRALVTAAIESGDSPADLSDAVKDSFEFSESRADMIARTELAHAHVQGNVQGWRETGQVEKKQSILGDNHEEEDECDDAADQGAIALDEEFDSGDFGPPYHPNCVCALIPVLVDEAEAEEDQ